MAISTELPRWDLTPYFPSVTSPEYAKEKGSLDELIEAADGALSTAQAIASEDKPALARGLFEVVKKLDEATDRVWTASNYVGISVAADSLDESARAAESEMNPTLIKLSKLSTKFKSWIGTLPVEELVDLNAQLEIYRFPLTKAKKDAAHLMTSAEENLAADLSDSGTEAWSRLYDNFTSQIEVSIDGASLPMSAIRTYAYDSDGAKRKAGYEAELAAWKRNELPISAALNAIKGSANLLAERRGWDSQLDITLHQCNMDRGTLDAMMSAAEDSFVDWRRYLRSKAKLLGYEGGLKFYDVFAPVGKDANWNYDAAMKFVEDGFRLYSDKMADFAVRTFRENWVDVGPRKGKRDGAFCCDMRGDESRILMNYKPSFGSVATLAHELGHAYHNVCLAERTALLRRTPMTLAETASIFCETIIKRQAIGSTSGEEKLAILEASLQGACQVVVDISSRYKFETTVITGRKQRELSAREMCEAMRDAQLATYGDGLDSEALHPYMWAAKPHYYSYSSFYNFPYMFGLLFALGLYAIYQKEPQGFHERYDELLSNTGLFDAATLAANFGIDIRSKEFWAGSLSVLKNDIDEFVAMVETQA